MKKITVLAMTLFYCNVCMGEQSLQTITVYGDNNLVLPKDIALESNAGKRVINQNEINSTPLGNASISEVVRTVPGVEYSDPAKTSSQGGEIAPGRLSISGGRPYQNNFIVDGLPNNNIIDPNSSSTDDYGRLSGHAQDHFIDVELVDRLVVYTSNVPAKYGRFTGGVVDVTLKKPDQRASGRFSVRHTSDRQTQFHIDNKQIFEFENSSSSNSQPKFDKWQYGLFLNKPLTDTSAFYIDLKRNTSTIPLRHLGGSKSESRQLDNALLKYSSDITDNHVLDLTLNYSPYEEVRFSQGVKDSDYKVIGGGEAIKFALDSVLDTGLLTSNFGVTRSQSERIASSNYYEWARSPSKSWGAFTSTQNRSREGAKGHLKQEQNRIFYSADYERTPFKLIGSDSIFKTGLMLENVSARKFRRADASAYFVGQDEDSRPISGMSRLRCNGAEACVESEQYAAYKNVHLAEDNQADITSLGAYIENTWHYDRFSLRLGLRYDYNNFMQNNDFAYRSFAKLDLFGNHSVYLTGGLNRYYGQTFLTYKLQQAGNTYQRYYRGLVGEIDGFGRRTFSPKEWVLSSDRNLNRYNYSELKTPYKDEHSIGFESQLFNGVLSIEYLGRQGKNEFSQSHSLVRQDGYRYYEQANDGWSRFDQLSLSWQKVWGNQLLKMAFTKANSKTSNLSYDQQVQEDQVLTKVYFIDRLVEHASIPSTPVIIPNRFAMSYHYMPDVGFGVGSYLNWTQAYTNLEYTGELYRYRSDENELLAATIYDYVNYGEQLTVDLSLRYKLKLGNKVLETTVDINNLFDQMQTITAKREQYRLGRQFWLGVKYAW